MLHHHVRDRTDLVGRLGGDEFAAWMPGATGQRGVEVAERVATDLRDSQDAAIRVSIGVACYRADECSVQALVTAADEAMYDAKRSKAAVRIATRTPRPLPDHDGR